MPNKCWICGWILLDIDQFPPDRGSCSYMKSSFCSVLCEVRLAKFAIQRSRIDTLDMFMLAFVITSRNPMKSFGPKSLETESFCLHPFGRCTDCGSMKYLLPASLLLHFCHSKSEPIKLWQKFTWHDICHSIYTHEDHSVSKGKDDVSQTTTYMLTPPTATFPKVYIPWNGFYDFDAFQRLRPLQKNTDLDEIHAGEKH